MAASEQRVYISVLMRDIAGAREPVAAIAIVADDLTGAADTGAAFAGAGLSALVTWGPGSLARAVRQADALAIDAGTRALDVATAAAKTAEIVRAVRTAGVEAIYKKGDSLLRGHIAAETAAGTRRPGRPERLRLRRSRFPMPGAPRSTAGSAPASSKAPSRLCRSSSAPA